MRKAKPGTDDEIAHARTMLYSFHLKKTEIGLCGILSKILPFYVMVTTLAAILAAI